MVTNDKDTGSYNKLLSQLEIEFFSKYDLLFSIIAENEEYYSANENRLPFFKNVRSEGVVLYG